MQKRKVKKKNIVSKDGQVAHDPISGSDYQIILNYHLIVGPLLKPRKQALPQKCKHPVISVISYGTVKKIICKKCRYELKRWLVKPGINFEELLIQREFIFGDPPELDWESAHKFK